MRPRPDPRPDPRSDLFGAGFTLIEIAVVLVILALAYGLVTPAFSNFVAGTRLENAARELAMALREARSTAIITGRTLQFDIDPTTPGWRFGDRRGAFDRGIAVGIEAATGGEESDIAFFADGSSTGGRIRLENADQGRMIEIHWLTGRVTQSAF